MGLGLDLTARRKDGSELAVEISLSPIEPRGGSAIIASVRDASERKRFEALREKSRALEEENLRIEEANRLKSEFLANMSHELRTPLNAILGFADLMHSGKVGPLAENHREYLGDILTSSRHLHQLVNDVLDLAKIEAGKVELRPEAIDLEKAVTEVRDILRGLPGPMSVRSDIAVDPRLTRVVLDPHKLKQVLYNYLSNAIKFSKADGRVRVHAYPVSDESVLRIDVTDEGIGIRESDLPRLFVEFQQLDAGRSKHYPGTGLGLAVTKRVVEAQGGRVGVTSVLGSGSTFWVELPLVKAEVVRDG
jgi:signal transduction histidine kinase